MNTNYLKAFTKDSISYKDYYRNINNSISISKNNKEIITKLITKDIFINYDSELKKALKNKMIQGIWVDQYASLISNKVVLSVLFKIPGTNDSEYYSLSFNEDGSFHINNELKQKFI